jgi:CspA family cold shock protein
MSVNEVSSKVKMIGNVKWFNNKAGFGFITMDENTDSQKDIFAHYSNINVKNSQYKYLVQGEYVEFDISATTDSSHEFQATNITGIHNGATLCERRRMSRDSDEGDVDFKDRKTIESTQPPRLNRSQSVSVSRRHTNNIKQPVDNDDGFITIKKKNLI